jgi:ribose transport system ATP-binding protein
MALLVMILAVGAYTGIREPIFLEEPNLNALLALSLPLIVVAFGQQMALLAGGFDISVGAMMTLTVVFVSFSVTADSLTGIIPGVLLVLGLGAAVGLGNGLIVRMLNVNPIIATIGMLGILAGISLIRRPTPGGLISPQLDSKLIQPHIGFLPISFLVLAAVAVAAQLVLMRTGAGLNLRATGFNEEASHRLGIRVTPIKIGAFVACSTIAAVAGLFLAAQTGVGSADIGDSYALPSIAACVIGGASLGGGRGSFVGCVMAAVFLTLLVNIAPLLQLSPSYSDLITGVLTLLAVVAYTLNRRAVG